MSAGKEEQACGGLYSGEAKRGNTREDLCHFALEITHVKVWAVSYTHLTLPTMAVV